MEIHINTKVIAIIKVILFLVFLFSGLFIFAQRKTGLSAFDSEIIKIAEANKSNTFFYKSANFFVDKNYDSTLVFTMKFLNSSKKTKSLNDFAHYFRGYSFKQKRMFPESKKEFDLVTTGFDFNFLVKKRLAEIAIEKNEFKVAISYLQPLTKLSQKQYNYLDRSTVLQNIGLCYFHLNQFKEAEPYFLENVALRERQKDTLGLITAFINMGNFYYEQYKDNLAIPYFEKAYQLSKNIKDIESKQLTANNMAVVEENRKHFKEALAYRKESEQWKDSLNNQNKIYEVANLERQFAVKQKQKEVDLLEAENKAKEIEKNGLLYSAIVLLLLLVTAIYFYREKLKTNKIITAQKERLDALNATKDKLFSIVSHDLRSSVNALKMSNTKLLDNLEAKNLDALDDLLQTNSAIVNGAYNLLDNLLHWALLQTNQSYFEITSLRLFFIVEQTVYNYKPLMLEKQITFENTVSKQDVVFVDQESLKIILRNLLDNAIKFSNTNGSIKIYTQNAYDAFLDLIVEDSGAGMSASKRQELLSETTVLSKKENENIIGTGLGLQLCKSMIKKNNGTFSIESTLGSGTKMIISLPKKG